MRRALAASLACAATMAFAAEQASACSCAPITAASFERGGAAIVAKLTAIETIDSGPSVAGQIFHYRVLEVLKGEKRLRKPRVAVYSDTSTCAMGGKVGDRQGLLLYRRDRRWRGNLCGQTTPRRLRQVLDDRRDRAASLCARA